MSRALPLLARTALLGIAAGGRSSSGPAGLAWSSRTTDPAPLDRLASPRFRGVVSTFALGELVVDKLPQTPSRLSVGPLVARLLIGAATGIGLTGRAGPVPLRSLPVRVLVPGAVVGAAAAGVGSHLGAAWRRRSPIGSDLPAALVEDLVVATLVYVGCRR
jgi:uncharacterized membrane protein